MGWKEFKVWHMCVMSLFHSNARFFHHPNMAQKKMSESQLSLKSVESLFVAHLSHLRGLSLPFLLNRTVKYYSNKMPFFWRRFLYNTFVNLLYARNLSNLSEICLILLLLIFFPFSCKIHTVYHGRWQIVDKKIQA